MKDIIIPLAYGDETKEMRLSFPMGAGGCWFVSVDNYHYGKICWQQGEWRPHFNPDTELTTVDICMIVDLLYERMPDGAV